MKQIAIKATPETVEKIKRSIEEKNKRMESKFPPQEIMDFINRKTEETNVINGGGLDKSTFMLGMVCMWSYLNKA